MSEKWVLAIDQGTTGTTVLTFDQNRQVTRRLYAEFPQIYPQPGWVEHDAQLIWESLIQLIDQAVHNGQPIAAIGITNQRETTVVWDKVTGLPIHNAIVWQCRRTAETCRELAAHADLFRARTGLVLDAYFSGTKIKWLLENVPGAREKAESGQLLFGTIDSWLIWKLSGGTHITDYTNASRTLLLDIHKRSWDPELLDLLNIPASMLPRLVPSSGICATVAKGPLAGVPIAGIAGDQQASLYGLGCYKPGLVKNTYGTGCFIMKYLGDRATESEHGLLTTLACDEHGQPAYALEGSIFTAGAAVQWLRDGLGIIENASQTEAMALSLVDNGGVYFVPAFVGLGAPYWDSQARGCLVGLTAGVGRAHLVRATLEALAYQTRDVLEAMSADSGLAITQLHADGGAANNDFLMQFQADQLGIDVLRHEEVEKTAFGAALLAGKAISFWDQEQLDSQTRMFQPKMSEQQQQYLYQSWKQALAQTRLSSGP